MTSDRDPAIGALLDRVEVTPSGPTFWSDVQARLVDGDDVIQLRAPSRRPRRRTAIAALAVAAAAALLAFVVSRAGTDDDQKVVPAGTSTSVTTTTPSTVSAEGARADQAVRDWIIALTTGQADAAWALVGSQSRDSIGGRPAFDALFPTLPLSWEPWTAAALVHHTLLLSPEAAEQLWVVDIGTPAGEPSPASIAVVVRLTAGSAEVEPFVPGPALSLVSLPVATTDGLPVVSNGTPIQVHVDANTAVDVIAVDGVAVAPSQLDRDASGAIVAVRPGPLGAGPHHITVAVYGGAPNTIAAQTASFRTP